MEERQDLISRQAAIDALWAERMKLSEEMERNLETCSFALRADNKTRRNRIEEDIEIIKQLPPAQSEYEPVKAEDFANNVREYALQFYGMA